MKKKEPESEPTLDQMTLRDLMAMFAMVGAVSSGNARVNLGHAERAEFAYNQADAMIEERKPKMKSEDQTPIRKGMDAPGMY